VVGDEINIAGALAGVTFAAVGFGQGELTGTSSEIIDAEDTALFAINFLTPDVGYTSASGTAYRTSLIDTSIQQIIVVLSDI
jgi:hypothetical protein